MFLSLKLIQLVLIIQLRRINEILGEAVKLVKCERCGVESEGDPCVLCQRENGVIGETRLRNALKLLWDKYSDRKHGFSLGEAMNALPFNFMFTRTILRKLYNFNILTKETVQGSVRFEFSGRTLDSNYNVKPPVKDIKKDYNIKEDLQKESGIVKYSNEIIKEALALYDDEHSLQEIRNILIKVHEVKPSKITIQGWIDDFNDGILILDDDERPSEKVSSKKKEFRKVEAVRMAEKEVNKYYCKYCGVSVRAHHIACRKCRPQWLKELFNQIKPLFEKNELIFRDDIAKAWGKNSSSIHKVVEEIVALKWLNKSKDGVYVQYSLPGKMIAEDPEPEIEESEPKNIPKERPILKTVTNDELTKEQKIKMEYKINERKESIAAEELINLPSSIQLISNLLPSLILATIITIEPGNNMLDAGFAEQKTLLDLYEVLPNQLKSIVKLHINPESPIQKISIPLEG